MTSSRPTESEMTSTTTTQFSHYQQSSDILRILNQQRNDATFSDVILRAADDDASPIYAHRCILAASSEYFSALFRHDLSGPNYAKTAEIVVPMSSRDVIARVIDFLYTGVIDVSEESLEETVRLADFLGIRRILDFCSVFMRQKLDCRNCLKFKVLADIYPFGGMAELVRNYILPRMATVIRSHETTEAPVETLRQLLTDNELNYPNESDLLYLIRKVVQSHSDLDPSDRAKALDLFDCIDFDFLSPDVIKRDILSSDEVLEWVNSRPQLRASLQNIAVDGEVHTESRRNFLEAIICRSKALRTGEELQLLLYLVREDSWRTLRQPNDDKELGTRIGLESMVVHDGSLFTLSSCTEDMNGYMHPPKETKIFSRLKIRSGEWERLPSPSVLSRQTMLASVEDTVVAVDSTGRVERYLEGSKEWIVWCGEAFPGLQKTTICFLPVSKGGDLYLLRTVSAGYSFEFFQRGFTLYHLTARSQSWAELSQIEDVDLFHNCPQVNLFDCVVSPGLMAFKDELGHTRAEFNIGSGEWSARPQMVHRPAFVRDVFGSAECGQRVFFVARSALSLDNIFAMYDHAKDRFKMVQEPPAGISGLLCHVTIPASSLELLARS